MASDTLDIPGVVSPPDFSCLTRPEKEKIDSCFEENIACHQALEDVAPPVQYPMWETILISFGAGLLGGMVLKNNLR